jgi:peptidoglycan/LPS O-acetylase OafA/YrhL
MVVFFHLSWQQSDPQIFLEPGWVGVEVFFVISGFVIMSSASKATPIEFVERRIARLYPAAIVCAVVSFVVLRSFRSQAVIYGLDQYPTGHNMIRSMLLLKGPFAVSSLWTLPVELAFYALIFLVLVFGRIKSVTPIASALILWSGLYLVPFALTECGLVQLHVGPFDLGPINATLLRHGCFFGLGMLLWQVEINRPRAIEIAALAVAIILCYAEIIARAAELKSHYAYPVRFDHLAATAVALFTVAVLAIWLLGRSKDRVRLTPRMKHLLRRVGLMTYPLYLMHDALGGVAFSLTRLSGHEQGLALAMGVALSLLGSLLVVEFAEPWLRRLLLAVVHPVLVQITANPRRAHWLGKFSLKGAVAQPRNVD